MRLNPGPLGLIKTVQETEKMRTEQMYMMVDSLSRVFVASQQSHGIPACIADRQSAVNRHFRRPMVVDDHAPDHASHRRLRPLLQLSAVRWRHSRGRQRQRGTASADRAVAGAAAPDDDVTDRRHWRHDDDVIEHVVEREDDDGDGRDHVNDDEQSNCRLHSKWRSVGAINKAT